ncbi:MAG: FG-GAP repeat protein [Gammaproteobacteria bacterium]|nr:FG-GAP repeat protein [Gammaproteobacteria bacterium]
MNTERHFSLSNAINTFLALTLLSMLTACGGDDDDSSKNLELAVALNGIKTLQFTWTDGDGADHFKLLENPDGASGFTQVGANIAATETSVDHEIAVHLLDWPNVRYILEACNDGGCTQSDEISLMNNPVIEEAIGYVKASNTGVEDSFGGAIAVSGDGSTLAVGAPYEDSAATGIDGNQTDDCDEAVANCEENSGAVYVFVRNGAEWEQQAYIKASNTGAHTHFGSYVVLSFSGDTLAISAEDEDSAATGINGNQIDDCDADSATNCAKSSGAVYVFTRNDNSEWAQQAYIKASNTDENNLFGKRLSLNAHNDPNVDGNTLAVGAIWEDSAATGINGNQVCDAGEPENCAPHSGAVYVFTRDGTDWTQQAYVKASNTDAQDFFGASLHVSADGNTLAVGAYRESSGATGINGNQINDCGEEEPTNCILDSGAIYVFTRNNGAEWAQQAYIKASNTGKTDYFGWDVSISGDGNTVAVGAASEDSGATSGTDSGAVYVFTRDGTDWTQQAYIKASNIGEEDHFGWDILLSADGNTLVAGTGQEDSAATGVNGDENDNSLADAGAVYLFTRNNDEWAQQTYIKAPNTDENDRFHSVSLSADAKTLVIGAPGENSNATGVNGDQTNNDAKDAGAVYIY